MVVEFVVTVKVEVVDEEDEVLWGDLTVAVFSFELAELFGADEAGAVTINPSKGGVWLKVSDCGQYLPHLLDGKLLVSNQ